MAGAGRWALPGPARARPSVARTFCRSSRMTHWAHPSTLPLGAVPSFGFDARLERVPVDQAEAEWVPQSGLSRLGLILDFCCPSFLPPHHSCLHSTNKGTRLLILFSWHIQFPGKGSGQGMGRQRPYCNHLACTPPGPRACPGVWPTELPSFDCG